jgi:hypothetical protein
MFFKHMKSEGHTSYVVLMDRINLGYLRKQFSLKYQLCYTLLAHVRLVLQLPPHHHSYDAEIATLYSSNICIQNVQITNYGHLLTYVLEQRTERCIPCLNTLSLYMRSLLLCILNALRWQRNVHTLRKSYDKYRLHMRSNRSFST